MYSWSAAGNRIKEFGEDVRLFCVSWSIFSLFLQPDLSNMISFRDFNVL